MTEIDYSLTALSQLMLWKSFRVAELEHFCQRIGQTSLGFKILDMFYLNDRRAELLRV
jgi:hypothetical protein